MSKKTVFIWLLAFALPTILAAQTGTIRGKVIDQENGDVLPGANITIMGTSIGTAAGTSGDYVIEGVPAGVYNLRASFIGYATYQSKIRVNAINENLNIILIKAAYKKFGFAVANSIGGIGVNSWLAFQQQWSILAANMAVDFFC